MGPGQGSDPQRRPLVVVPYLPPSSNHIYINISRGKKGGGGRFLSKEAEAFKNQMMFLVATSTAHLNLEAIPKKDPNALFEVFYVFFFPEEDLLNGTYGNGTKKAAATRYKRMDAENRIKLVADAFSKGIGIDDSLFFCGGHAKCSARLVGGQPQIHIFFEQADPKRYGL